MPIRNCLFTSSDGIYYRPHLNLQITNPHTGDSYRTYGIVDTGADKCAIPAAYAPIIGHNLTAVPPGSAGTAGGHTDTFPHTTRIEIYHPVTDALLYTIQDTTIDFMDGLPLVLLGVQEFLNDFLLHVNYPNQVFSVRSP